MMFRHFAALVMTGVMIAAISVPVFADDGGAIYFGGDPSVDTTFTDHTANGNGGAIYLDGGDPVVDTTFTDNTAGGNGGAIYFGAE